MFWMPPPLKYELAKHWRASSRNVVKLYMEHLGVHEESSLFVYSSHIIYKQIWGKGLHYASYYVHDIFVNVDLLIN